MTTRRTFLGQTATAGLAGAASTAEAAPAAPASHRFRLALNTATIRGQKLSVPEQFETAAAAGYEGLEPWTGDLSKFVQTGGSLKDLAKRREDLGLAVVSAIGFAQWAVDDDERRAQSVEQLKRDMDVLAQLGGTHIAASPAGVNRPGVTLDLDRAAERYRAILEIGQAAGVIPQLEVWGPSANLSRLAEALYVAAQSGHPAACVLADAFHLYKAGDGAAALHLLSRTAIHCFHLNDYPADPPREEIRDGDRLWPGDGVAPLTELLTTLAHNHCEVWLSLEVFNKAYWALPAAEAATTGLAKMKTVLDRAGLTWNG